MSWARAGWLTSDYVPNSQVVQSDDEFKKWYDAKMATPRFEMTDAFADPGIRSEANASLNKAWMDGFSPQTPTETAALQAVFDKATSLGVGIMPGQQDSGASAWLGINPYTDAGSTIATSMGASHTVQGAERPEYAAAVAEANKAKQERIDAMKRQTAAYGQMQGGNFFGGMMDGRYSEAFGGQMQQGTQANGDPTSGGGATNVPGFSSFGEAFGSKPRQYRAGAWGGYGW